MVEGPKQNLGQRAHGDDHQGAAVQELVRQTRTPQGHPEHGEAGEDNVSHRNTKDATPSRKGLCKEGAQGPAEGAPQAAVHPAKLP